MFIRTGAARADSIGRRNIVNKEVFNGTAQGLDGAADRKSANALTWASSD
ncbi:hypothetical protein [Haliea sp.]|nr:hypothetical protein [Haliea sp.]